MATSRFVWHDLMTTDAEAAKRFYGDLFGWTYEVWQPETANYPMISAAGRQWGGVVASEGGGSRWIGYVGVDDVAAAVERVREHGGSVHVEPSEIPEIGKWAIVADPTGAVFAFYESRSEGQAPPERTPPGGFVWDELLTPDVERCAEFYRDVVGWEQREWPMGERGTYHVFRSGESELAGMMESPPGMEAPPHWVVYVAVEDADAAYARAQELGALAYTPILELETVGRFASLGDPQGAAFAILEPQSGG